MSRTRRPITTRRHAFRPTLIRLEDRIAPAQVLWAVDANGFWDVPANWSTGTIDLSDPSGTGHHLTVTNGLTLNGTLLLDSSYSSVSALGTQTLGGTGTVHFGTVTGTRPSLATDYSGPLTLGPNLTILAGN